MRWILLAIVAAFVPFTHAQSDKEVPPEARISRARSTGQTEGVTDRHLRGQISGAVINEYGTPIDKARVWMDVAASGNLDNSISLRRQPIPGKTQFAVTDENGRCECLLDEGSQSANLDSKTKHVQHPHGMIDVKLHSLPPARLQPEEG